jgi:signal transduction histidine kinase
LTIATENVDLRGAQTIGGPGNGPHVMLSVTDTGDGIDDATLDRVFEPFFTTKRVSGGTGLGLSVSLGIAEAHGGSLALNKTRGGCCFRLTLPAVAVAAEPEAAACATV